MITNSRTKNVDPDSYYFPIVFAVTTCVGGFILPNPTDWPNSWVEVVACFWLTSAFVADLTITFTLVWDLVRSIFLILCAKFVVMCADITHQRYTEQEEDGIPLH